MVGVGNRKKAPFPLPTQHLRVLPHSLPRPQRWGETACLSPLQGPAAEAAYGGESSYLGEYTQQNSGTISDAGV